MKKLLVIFIGLFLLSLAFAQPELGMGQVWQKNPENPVFLNEGETGTWNAGEDIFSNQASCVIWDSLASEYKMYITGRSSDNIRSIGLFTCDSLSGTWMPDEHNPVFEADTSFWATYSIFSPQVMIDSNAYKMWFAGQSEVSGEHKIGYAESSDGINWTPHETPVLEKRSETYWDSEMIWHMYVVKRGKNDYIAWYTGEGDELQIGCVISSDGITWTRASDNPVLRSETPTMGWMGWMYVKMIDNKYLMWYSGSDHDYISQEPGKVHFAISDDGINWRRDELYNPMFRNGTSGQWDERCVLVTNVFDREDHYEMVYFGVDDDWEHVSLGTATFKPTEIASGDVSGTWTKESSPYLVRGEITVPNGNTLTIEPGTTVEFCGYYPLNIQGRLLAEGTASNRIRFWRDDTLSFSSFNNKNGAWGGIRFDETASTNDSSLIKHCDIAFCKSLDNYGGGIYVKSFAKLSIENSHIHHNYAVSNDNNYAAGAGIYLQSNSNIKIQNNTIQYNTAKNLILDNRASGGGIAVIESDPRITGNTIRYNRCTELGGGLCIFTNASPFVANNLIVKNTSLWFDSVSPSGHGGGVGTGDGGKPIFINNTIANNTAQFAGGFFINAGDVVIFNTIIANNTAYGYYDQLSHYNPTGRDIKIYYSCLEGQAGTEWEDDVAIDTSNVITDDPRLSSSYNLYSSSPCICSARRFCSTDGVTNIWAPITDYKDNARPQPDSTYPDIGAIESAHGNIPDPTVDIVDIPDNFVLQQNYPNPFNPRTAISYQLSADSDIELTIYDITGRKIKTLINEYQSSGYHTVNWDASGFSSGIYFYRLIAGEFIETKKMVLMK